MSKFLKRCIAWAIALSCHAGVFGQALTDSTVIDKDTVSFKETQDTTIFTRPPRQGMVLVSDTTYTATDTTRSVEIAYKKHSPAKATMMSAVVPGLGQVYNKKIWKVPIVWAAIGISSYYLIKWQNEYQMYRRAYIDYKDQDPTTNSFVNLNIPPNVSAENYLTFYKDRDRRYRDWMIVAVAASYMLNILDANVDAHFFDYNIDDNLSMHVMPVFFDRNQKSSKFGVYLCFTF